MWVMAVCVRMAIEELTPGMTFRMEFLWVVWWEGVRRERIVSLATELSRIRRVGCDAGVSSRARQAARFSPVLLEEGEFPIVGGGACLWRSMESWDGAARRGEGGYHSQWMMILG